MKSLIHWANASSIHEERTERIRSATDLVMREVRATDPWLRRHVSDHSAVHYGAEVLGLLMEIGSAVQATRAIVTALDRGHILLVAHPEHEALWKYRRLCVVLMFGISGETIRPWCGKRKLHMNYEREDEKLSRVKEICATLGHDGVVDGGITLQNVLQDYLRRDIDRVLNIKCGDCMKSKNNVSWNCLSSILLDDERSHTHDSLSYVSWILWHFNKFYDMDENIAFGLFRDEIHRELRNNNSILHNMW
eukprot:CAMPEP_0113299066 /NCGR_PEP_ID=MMETSP0010_2-20120614/1250_1 /TAXON_ID=216773 ORGANISM="Corethron hystrix, Strain 308" /NCGR_SAMPLE_ID=MMETSP0010_2 /ASSEMBLY_ACC=CAM_ASM_000155 /LENGTH=248 /DNA_ID=CAMNT_0000152227 /DNA_START=111 /DNA_END=854 /DNA_ORIENTATION=- /assembly_acc=CAM_ASM_000155